MPQLKVVEPEIVEVNLEELKQESNKLILEARALADGIKDEESYNRATFFYSALGKQVKKWKLFYEKSKKKTYEAWKSVCADESALVNPLEAASKELLQPIKDWEAIQERKRREEQDRLQKEAQKKLDDQRLAEAQALQECGDIEAAEEVISSPVVAAAPVFVAPKVAGIKSFRDNWQAKVTDIKALCKDVVDGKVASTVIEPNMSVLNAMARASKSELRIAGVVVSNEKIPVRG